MLNHHDGISIVANWSQVFHDTRMARARKLSNIEGPGHEVFGLIMVERFSDCSHLTGLQ